MAVYDKEKEKTKPSKDGSHDDLGVHPERREAEVEQLEKQFKDSGELKSAEEAGGTPATSVGGEEEEKLGEGYREEGGKWSPKKRTRFTRRQKLIGGGAAALLGGGGIAVFMMFSPALRLESYMQRINQRAFALAGNAIEARAGHLLELYMVKHVANLETCTRVNSIDCRADYTKNGIASGLYLAWRDARIEQKLFDHYGIQVESTRNNDGSGRHTLRDRFGKQITFKNGGFEGGEFTGGSRELGRDFRHFLKENTRWYQVMERRSVRKYLERKHGMKLWCFFACKTRDNVELRKASAITRFKYRFVERFVYPFSGKYGFIMNCMISSGDKCTSEELRKKGIDRTKLPDSEAKEFTEIMDRFGREGNQRLFTYVLEKLLAKVMGDIAAKTATGAIPVAGQIYLALTVADMLDRIDQYIEDGRLSKLHADLASRQYLEYYAGMRSMNDEMKSHVLKVDEVGAVMGDFKGAEDSRVYQAYNNPTTAQQYIARDTAHKCANGKPIPQDELVCPEKKISRTFLVEDIRKNPAVDTIADLLNTYGRCIGTEVFGRCPQGEPKKYIRPILESINWVTGAIMGPVSDGFLAAIKAIPGLGSIIGLAEQKFSDALKALFTAVFPLPVDLASPGRDKYGGIEGGGEVAAMEFGKGGYTDSGEPYGLGAPAISDQQAASIYQEYMDQLEYEYKNSSLIAKLTNMDYPDSFANNLIDSTPSDVGEMPRYMASGISKFFSSLFDVSNYMALFGRTPAYAQVPQGAHNAFGVTRYGYPLGDPAFTADPAQLTEESCKASKERRLKSLRENPVTGFDEYSVADPCLLEMVTVEASGSFLINGNGQ